MVYGEELSVFLDLWSQCSRPRTVPVIKIDLETHSSAPLLYFDINAYRFQHPGAMAQAKQLIRYATITSGHFTPSTILLHTILHH
jgi:hypothetical protein